MNSVVEHHPGDLVMLPSGRMATVERWRVTGSGGEQERVCLVRLKDGTTLSFSERYMALAENRMRR